jgi:GNAT superfamily N-acetyltransferase
MSPERRYGGSAWQAPKGTSFCQITGFVHRGIIPTTVEGNQDMLKDYPKTIVTKDGISMQLRLVAITDEELLRKLFSEIPEAEQWFLRENLRDPEKLHHWIENLDNNKIIPLIAVKEDDGQIVANLRLYRSCSGCACHVGHVRAMVHPAYRAQKIGSWMLLDCAKLASDMGIEKLVAEFVGGVEDVAIRAARKLDFHQEACLKEYVKDPNGNYRDLIIMVKNLSPEWGDF